MKCRKRPIVVEAIQWFLRGDHVAVGYYRNPNDPGDRRCRICGQRMCQHGWIDRGEGGHTVCPGDWIITGVQGEHYPCKPDIFEATYEPVGSED